MFPRLLSHARTRDLRTSSVSLHVAERPPPTLRSYSSARIDGPHAPASGLRAEEGEGVRGAVDAERRIGLNVRAPPIQLAAMKTVDLDAVGSGAADRLPRDRRHTRHVAEHAAVSRRRLLQRGREYDGRGVGR